MLTIEFEGWFQCRLATDPDLHDHPRGLAGSTFAVGSEPNLDRIIRLQAPVAPRPFGPTVGVVVTSVANNGTVVADHPLANATVELLDGPKFEGRNGEIAPPQEEPVDPFNLVISGSVVRIGRRDLLDPSNPDQLIDDVPDAILARRQPVLVDGVSAEVFTAITGHADGTAFATSRRDALTAAVAATTDPVQQQELNERLSHGIGITPGRLNYRFEINGPALITGKPEQFGGVIDTSVPWPVEFWFSLFDYDALCGYMKGTLNVPFVNMPIMDSQVPTSVRLSHESLAAELESATRRGSRRRSARSSR